MKIMALVTPKADVNFLHEEKYLQKKSQRMQSLFLVSMSPDEFSRKINEIVEHFQSQAQNYHYILAKKNTYTTEDSASLFPLCMFSILMNFVH